MKQYKPAMLFSQELLKLIVEGTKTQTRRPLKIDYSADHQNLIVHEGNLFQNSEKKMVFFFITGRWAPFCSLTPQYHPGDIVYIREAFTEWAKDEYQYKLDTPAGEELGIWKPSIHMPKKAARFFLKIINVRVELLKDISESDAIKEGFGSFAYPIDSFITTWRKLYIGTEYHSKNKLVWVYDFELVDKPNDF